MEENREATSAQDMGIIQNFPIDEIILNIEEVPPLDVFYSPKCKYVMTRPKKRQRMEKSPDRKSTL